MHIENHNTISSGIMAQITVYVCCREEEQGREKTRKNRGQGRGGRGGEGLKVTFKLSLEG